MHVTSTEEETVSTKTQETWEDDGGRAQPDSAAGIAPGQIESSAQESLPFPRTEAGTIVLKELELVRLIQSPTFGKYRIQQPGLGERGPVFLISLFGATCAKVQMMIARKLTWSDYLAAMKRAIERELGYLQARGETLPLSVPRTIDITLRDTDFAQS